MGGVPEEHVDWLIKKSDRAIFVYESFLDPSIKALFKDMGEALRTQTAEIDRLQAEMAKNETIEADAGQKAAEQMREAAAVRVENASPDERIRENQGDVMAAAIRSLPLPGDQSQEPDMDAEPEDDRFSP